MIARAGLRELPAIAALARKIWHTCYPGIITIEQIDYMLARMYDLGVMRQELAGGIRYEQLLVGGELHGFASYGPTEVPREIKLHKLYVHPQSQRQGHGSRLLRHVEDEGRRLGAELLILAVNKGNQKAIAAYRKNGFVVRESKVTDIGGGFVMDDFIFEKRLASLS